MNISFLSNLNLIVFALIFSLYSTIAKSDNHLTTNSSMLLDDDIDVAQIAHDFINMDIEISDPTTVDGYDEATTFFAMHHIALKYFFEQKDKKNLFKVSDKLNEFFEKSTVYKDEFEYLFFEEKSPTDHQEFID